MTTTSDPFSEADRLRLDPTYLRLQETEPVSWVRMPFGGEGWLATGYQEVRTVLADPRFSRWATVGNDVPRTSPVLENPNILSMDPPEHGRLRKLVAKAFTARRIEQLGVRAQEVVDAALDRIEAQGAPADLVPLLTTPLPITIICDLLGVPRRERGEFQAWSDVLLGFGAFGAEEIGAAFAGLQEYIAGMVAQRRRTPSDDMLGVLVQAHDDGDRLSEEELVVFGVTLLVAGHETTANLLGNAICTLFEHPTLLRSLVDDSDLLRPAVEELARVIPLAAMVALPRVVLEDVELGGVTARAGQTVLVSMAAANRDPSVFDAPGEIDFRRGSNPHLAFGHGVHHCLGAPLARMELQVAIGTLFRRFPTLELTVPVEDVEFKRGRLVRSPLALPVKW
ncbi:cytochrome P450 [Umezawaea sp. Da 62-37]|uniref:cytochrome P450 n=1 Tax=Umezawaea sp. Da 62-37 TaxID=3075927 RepID=UPI0028F6CBB5|nr:cytochrome P450 [Umezawaea sp. Da 62-37]WNV83308.1 cytochrome P450 [Umezawaea sp. Da 62-37]